MRHPFVELDLEFAAFDRLPASVRAALDACPVRISALDVAEALASGLTPQAVVRLIHDGAARERDAFAAAYSDFYGHTFAEADASVLRDPWPRRPDAVRSDRRPDGSHPLNPLARQG
jgi:hypothetical protein